MAKSVVLKTFINTKAVVEGLKGYVKYRPN